MIRSWLLKKTDSTIRESICRQRPDRFFRRVRPFGDSTATRQQLVSDASSDTASGHLHAQARCSSLAGILRCPRGQAVGLRPPTKTLTRGLGCAETHAPEVSRRATHPFDLGQLLTAWYSRGQTLVPSQQCSFDLDANQCLVAQPNRMPVHPRQGVRHSQFELHRPWRTQQGPETIRKLPKRLCKKVIEPFWKRH